MTHCPIKNKFKDETRRYLLNFRLSFALILSDSLVGVFRVLHKVNVSSREWGTIGLTNMFVRMTLTASEPISSYGSSKNARKMTIPLALVRVLVAVLRFAYYYYYYK